MLRLILVFIIIALIVRAFIIAGSTIQAEQKKTDIKDNDGNSRKGVPKGIGEYVDYEEVQKKT
jgi:hypothetical protein